MPQKVPQKPVCKECGSEALGEALFCYHCGAKLSVEEVGAVERNADSAPLSKDVDKPIEAPPGDPFEDLEEEPGEDPPESKSGSRERRKRESRGEPAARSASALRKDSGVMRMRRIETRWSRDDNGPNLWFLIATGIFFVLAFCVFLISLYLR